MSGLPVLATHRRNLSARAGLGAVVGSAFEPQDKWPSQGTPTAFRRKAQGCREERAATLG
jgi:hypothetical protein